MDAPVPARIDRAALERILQRATELQASDRDIGEGLTPDEVVALGAEVGVPAQFLRQAMLEERSRTAPQPPGGVLDHLVGRADLATVRVIHGDQDRIERGLLGYMQKHELLTIQRQLPGRITWERIGGVQAALRQVSHAFDGSRARFMLARTDLVHATITPLEPGYCHVTLGASLRGARSSIVGLSALAGSLGVAGAAVLVALNALWLTPLGPLALGTGLAWGISRRFRPQAERVLLGLERALDFAEGEAIRPAHELPPRGPGLLEVITGEVRRALSGPAAPTPPTRRPK